MEDLRNLSDKFNDLNTELEDLVLKHLETEDFNNFWNVDKCNQECKKPMRKIISVYTEQINVDQGEILKDYGFKPLTIKNDNILYWELEKDFLLDKNIYINIPYKKTKQLELKHSVTLLHLKENITEHQFGIS